MGIQIVVGGAGGQLGAGLGKGMLEGQAQAREDEIRAEEEQKRQVMADEVVQAISADFVNSADAVADQIPDVDPGQATMMLGGKLPMYLDPGPNKEQTEYDEWTSRQIRLLKAYKNPDAAKVHAQSLAKELDRMTRARVSKRLNSSMESAVQSGAVSEAEVAPFLEALATTSDVAKVYSDWNEFRKEKAEYAHRKARAGSLVGSIERSAKNYDDASKAAERADDSSWLQEQGRKMGDFLARVNSDIAFGIDDFDFDAMWEEYNAIHDALNPAQEQRVARELEAQKQAGRIELEAAETRNRAYTDRMTGLADQIDAALEAKDAQAALRLMRQQRSITEEWKAGNATAAPQAPSPTQVAPSAAALQQAPAPPAAPATKPQTFSEQQVLQDVTQFVAAIRNRSFSDPHEIERLATEYAKNLLAAKGVKSFDELKKTDPKLWRHMARMNTEVQEATKRPPISQQTPQLPIIQ